MTKQLNTCKQHVGIDVSKNSLDVYIYPIGKKLQVENSNSGFKSLIKSLKEFQLEIIALEATGGYERAAATKLNTIFGCVAVLNPRRVREFARAIGYSAKTDVIDAKVIAEFAKKIEPRIQPNPAPKQQKLADFKDRRHQLVVMLTQEKNRLSCAPKSVIPSIRKIINLLEKELSKIEGILLKMIEEDAVFSRKNKLLQTVKGVGNKVAISILADLPELGTVSGKEISALVGVAPFNKDSGNMKGKRCIWGGRARLRSSIYMAALVAAHSDKRIAAFYQRLCQAGKPKKVALVACMHKMLIIMNSMIKYETAWRYSD